MSKFTSLRSRGFVSETLETLNAEGFGHVRTAEIHGRWEHPSVLASFGSNVVIVASSTRRAWMLWSYLRDSLMQPGSIFGPDGLKFNRNFLEIEFIAAQGTGRITFAAINNLDKLRGYDFDAIFIA